MRNPLKAFARKRKPPVDTLAVEVARSTSAKAAAPALLLAAGMGVGFWWWTQWARGSAESEAAEYPMDNSTHKD